MIAHHSSGQPGWYEIKRTRMRSGVTPVVSFSFSDVRMGRGGGMNHERLRVPDVRKISNKAKAVDDCSADLCIPFHAEIKHAPKQPRAEHATGFAMILMQREA